MNKKDLLIKEAFSTSKIDRHDDVAQNCYSSTSIAVVRS